MIVEICHLSFSQSLTVDRSAIKALEQETPSAKALSFKLETAKSLQTETQKSGIQNFRTNVNQQFKHVFMLLMVRSCGKYHIYLVE